jgi:uncharacterized protein YprB with RNaseH-like and TPR domain
MWKQNVTMDKIVDNGHVLCWSAKWLGESGTHFMSVIPGKKAPTKQMLRGVHDLLDEADAVVHYNGKAFDIPTLNREFLTHGMTPPAPYKQVDLLEVVRDQFNFPINKLDYVCQRLGLGEKVRHPGFQMWVDCMAGDEAAWRKMESYNRHDVVILERLYEVLRPWVRNHPNPGAFDDRPDTKYQRYQCGACGGWSRGKKAISKTRTTLQGIS